MSMHLKSVPKFEFGTKGETLARLAPLLGEQYFVAQSLYTVDEWRSRRDGIVGEIIAKYAHEGSLVIRSSARGEDSGESSMAGAFTTFISVDPVLEAIVGAVDGVIASYGDDDGSHHILVQPMVENVVISGVVLTRELDTGSPYYVVNYDDVTGRTDGVTGGHGENKCILVRRGHVDALRSTRFLALLKVVGEVETVVGSDELDIEFCINAEGRIFILQVRPLAARRNWLPLESAEVHRLAERVKAGIVEGQKPVTELFGATTLFGEMPDWNPAEMIGNCPKPLALSLYRFLITDSSWAVARRNMGYRVLPDRPLLVSMQGRPYIDVRLSLNSFLPEGIDRAFADRLIDWQLGCLAENPEWHDKIEFAVAATCRDFSFGQYGDRLAAAGFEADEVAAFGNRLRQLTECCIQMGASGLQVLHDRTRRLGADASVGIGEDGRLRALHLLGACIENGTVPFAELARHAFIGVAFLKSAVGRGVLDQTDVDDFLKSVNTVAGEFARDMYLLSQSKLDRTEFLVRYGHLRPGTYDIASWRYDEHPELYLSGHCAEPPAHVPFAYSEAQQRDIDRLLTSEGYSFNLHVLTNYIAQAVRLREAAKFEFTKAVSEALKGLTVWGERRGVSRDDIAYLTIGQIAGEDDPSALRDMVDAARSFYSLTRAIRLPHLITSEVDADVIRLPLGSPTFITAKRVTAPIRVLRLNEVPDLNGEIVLIESADPGFDWIFSREISGLITKYGGANSHMAIRCAEFDLPAAIGCGERMFDMIAGEHKVELNCAARTIRLVR